MVRLLSGLVLAVLTIAAVLWLPVSALRVLACAVALLAAHEYAAIAGVNGAPSRALLLASVAAMCWLVSGATIPRSDVLLAVALAWLGVEVLVLDSPIQMAGTGLLAPVYIGVPLGMLAAVRAAAGWRAAMLVLAMVVVSDTAQYYTGRAFGRRPLAPSISPKKTVEGALGGLLAGAVLMTAAGPLVFGSSDRLLLAVLGALIAALGICGDLFESRLKRAAGMKDSSTLIPGHGGVFDRIDALLFATPAFYYMLLQTIA